MVRRGLLCLVGLAEFSEGVVKPHEHTFDTVVADRLQLLQHCKAQFSQIFSLYSDPDNAVIALLEGARSEPAGSVTDADGCVHSIRRVTDPTVIRQVQLFSGINRCISPTAITVIPPPSDIGATCANSRGNCRSPTRPTIS